MEETQYTETNTQHFSSSVVNSYNEWDTLEEVIVGIVDNAVVPPWDITTKASMPHKHRNFYLANAGKAFPKDLIDAANKELNNLATLLEKEGVIVQRPEKVNNSQSFSTPNWTSPCGLYQAMPRDLLLVIGNEIIESPMAWRTRYYEIEGYRKLLKYYFSKGAKWVSAPKPQLLDLLYNFEYKETTYCQDREYGITEFEPAFDAADFIRCGKDIFVQRSNVTNVFGIEWMRRYLGSSYKIHELFFNDPNPMHIDSTFMPLAPGYLLVNPKRVIEIPEMFREWKIIYAPPSSISSTHPLYMSSSWLGTMNVLMIDEKRVIVDPEEKDLISLLRQNGFETLPCSFRNFNAFGGSFHCATCDIRRRGSLQSYFDY